MLLPSRPSMPSRKELKGSSIRLAAQNLFWEEKGAFTGEVSPVMLKEVGCQYVIIGHSERRQFFGETDETVNRRMKAALEPGPEAHLLYRGDLEGEGRGEDLFGDRETVEGGLKGFGEEEMKESGHCL